MPGWAMLRQARGIVGSELGLYARANTPLSMAAEMFAYNLSNVLSGTLTATGDI
jgi:hypothetical protein